MTKYKLFLSVVFLIGFSTFSFGQEEQFHQLQLMENAQAIAINKNQPERILKEKTGETARVEPVRFVPLEGETDPKNTPNDPKKKSNDENDDDAKEKVSSSDATKQTPTKSAPVKTKPSVPEKTSDESIVEYNFIYLIFQKFKFAEIIE